MSTTETGSFDRPGPSEDEHTVAQSPAESYRAEDIDGGVVREAQNTFGTSGVYSFVDGDSIRRHPLPHTGGDTNR
jgi:hypothetical protein